VHLERAGEEQESWSKDFGEVTGFSGTNTGRYNPQVDHHHQDNEASGCRSIGEYEPRRRQDQQNEQDEGCEHSRESSPMNSVATCTA
jgi:hypothetical protein